MTAEYKRYYANKGDIWEDNEVGEYVRLSDAIAALEAVKAQVRDDTVRSAAIAAGNAIVRLATNVDPDNSPLRKQMLRVKMEKAVKAALKGGA